MHACMHACLPAATYLLSHPFSITCSTTKQFLSSSARQLYCEYSPTMLTNYIHEPGTKSPPPPNFLLPSRRHDELSMVRHVMLALERYAWSWNKDENIDFYPNLNCKMGWAWRRTQQPKCQENIALSMAHELKIADLMEL